ncbi:MAG: tetratricopeptide repeat protein [bacterium]|nr:tetratricopeptide repeat protein [bacterium]
MLKIPGSKSVQTVLKVSEIQADPELFAIPGETPSPEDIRSLLEKRYATDFGKLTVSLEDDVIRISFKPRSVDVNAEQIHSAAVRLARQRQFEPALEKWKQAVSVNPDDFEYHYHIGLVLYEQRRYDESGRALERAVRICPIHYKSHLALGLSRIKMNRLDEAVRHFAESVRLHRENVLGYLNLGAVASLQKRHNEAIEAFNHAIQYNPRESRAYLGIAKIYVHLNDTEAANSYFKKVIELAPGTPIAEFAKKSISESTAETATEVLQGDRLAALSKGTGYALAGNYTAAAEHYQIYLRNQTSDDFAWYLLGEAEIRKGRLDEAADDFRKCVRLNPKKGLYQKALGTIYHFQKKPAESAECFKRAIELGKIDPMVVTLYGIQLLRLRKIDEAMHQFRMALKKNQNNPLAMYQLAYAYSLKNDNKKAMEWLDKVNAVEFFAPIKEHARRLVNSLK